MIIANTTESHFVTISAVLAGKADLRRIIKATEERRKLYGKRTILFVDEVHRWNKAQQDALLPHVENGTITLIGATTENPYFTVIGALVSRSRIFQLRPLEEEDVNRVIQRALTDLEHGYGSKQIQLDQDALDHLIRVSGGDARNALNALELAVESTPPDDGDVIHVTLEVAQESIQRRAVLYDKAYGVC
jgi:putative ATPase